MTHKRNRPIKDKILDCLDNKIKNLHPDLREKLINELLILPCATNVVNCKKYVVDLLSIPEMGSHTKKYWISRGWSEAEAYIKSKQNTTKGFCSPYSLEFWTSKINPNTGNFYTIEESNFERNSRRPIRKEYWIVRGYSESESKKKSLEVKNKNNKSGSEKRKNLIELDRVTSRRCVEYWTIRGYSEEEARKKVSEYQTTFSLDKCIKKYGEIDGKKRWLERQEKWCKSYKKSNFSKISQELFWSIVNQLDDLDGIYFAQLGKDKSKDLSGANNEYRLKLEKMVLPDFIDTTQKKVIEFNGIYWHGEVGRGNKERHEKKIELYEKNGYKVLTICENQYRTNKSETIELCLNFLKKPIENL